MAAATGAVLVSRPVTFVTGNVKKLEEVRDILGQSIPFSPSSLICLNCKANRKKYEISKEKARLVALQVSGPMLVEDTCICFNALKGLPGPYM